jgi:hypothetical protein
VLDTSDNSIVSGATSEFLLDFNDADSIRMRYNSDLIEYGIIAQEYENVISQICIVNTGGTLILYVNGENVSSYNISPSPAQISANIGARDGGNSCFYGEIFDVSFTVNSYLSADWIKTDYNSQTDQLNILGSPEIMTMPETVEEVEWTPAEITTSLWLDGSDVATITKDASNRVGQWDDKSGNNRHATETNDDYKPVYGGEQINGIDAVNFRPNKKVNIDPFGADSYTWFMVTLSEAHSNLSMMGATTTYVPIGQSGSTSTNVFRINGVDDPPGLKFLVNGETSQSITTRGGCNAALTASAGVLSVYENVPVITSSIRIGWGDFSNWYSNAYFGEVLCLPGTPSVDDRQKIEGYLAHKWALEANLPAGHPYESAAPTTYVDKIPTYYFEGTVIGGISQYVERNIRLYRYDTGELMNTTTSVSGSFFITTTHSGTHYITCHDLPYGEYNDLIFGKITPGITYITPGITYD